jgi:hypothetical protein
MARMTESTRRLLQGTLLAAHLVLPPAAFAVSYPRPRDWIAHNVFNIIVFGEAGTLCVWAGLSDWSWQRKLFGTLAGLIGCWILLWLRETRQTPQMLVACLLFPGAASVALAIAIKLSPAYLVDSSEAGARSVWQFTVGQLLLFTSTVAVVIVLVQHSLDGEIAINPRLVLAEGAQISVLVLVWAALCRRWRKVRLALASVVACAVGLTVQSFMSDSWFWEVLQDFRYMPAARIWEDLLSIPVAILLEAYLAAGTVMAVRSGPPSAPSTGPAP